MPIFAHLFASANLNVWPCISLTLFFTVMLVACAWALRPSAKQLYSEASRYALEDDPRKPKEKKP